MITHLLCRQHLLLVVILLLSCAGRSPRSRGNSRRQLRRHRSRCRSFTGLRTANERMEMTVNTSRILTLDQKIPPGPGQQSGAAGTDSPFADRNPGVGQAPGATQINLWGKQAGLHHRRDRVRRRRQAWACWLQSQFPNASLRIVPVQSGVLINGYVDRAEDVEPDPADRRRVLPQGDQCDQRRRRAAGAVAREGDGSFADQAAAIGLRLALATGGNTFGQSVSGLLGLGVDGTVSNLVRAPSPSTSRSGNTAFFGVLDALRQDGLMKIMAEPTP